MESSNLTNTESDHPDTFQEPNNMRQLIRASVHAQALLSSDPTLAGVRRTFSRLRARWDRLGGPAELAVQRLSKEKLDVKSRQKVLIIDSKRLPIHILNYQSREVSLRESLSSIVSTLLTWT